MVSLPQSTRIRLLQAVGLVAGLCLPLLGWGAEVVRLQLKWRHQFQFAGYYAALEQGYFREAGLDVQLLEATAGTDPADVVLSGKADYGVGTSELVVLAAAGKPVVLLAPIFQHSPLVLLVRADSGIWSAHDVVGKRVAIEPQAAELLAYLQREGVALNKLARQAHGGTVEALQNGQVDALSAYRTDEPFELQQAKVAYLSLDPRMGGIDFYGDTLFTTRTELRDRPDRVAAIRNAVLRGWRWALAHPTQTIDLIWERYSQRHSRAHLAFEAAETRKLVLPDIVEVGYLNPGRIEHIAEVYRELGMIKGQTPNLRDHLYDPSPKPDERRYWWALAGLGALLLAVGSAGLRYRRLAKRLQAAETELRELALTDALTLLPNRRAGLARLTAECAQALRHGRPLSIAMLDVDYFKRINDRWGHPVGDQVLRELATRVQANLRDTDLMARLGGEEFLVILHGSDSQGAVVLAQRLRERVAGSPVAVPHTDLEVTISIGVATLLPVPSDAVLGAHQVGDDLLRQADQAMYRAKNAGRNCVVLAS